MKFNIKNITMNRKRNQSYLYSKFYYVLPFRSYFDFFSIKTIKIYQKTKQLIFPKNLNFINYKILLKNVLIDDYKKFLKEQDFFYQFFIYIEKIINYSIKIKIFNYLNIFKKFKILINLKKKINYLTENKIKILSLKDITKLLSKFNLNIFIIPTDFLILYFQHNKKNYINKKFLERKYYFNFIITKKKKFFFDYKFNFLNSFLLINNYNENKFIKKFRTIFFNKINKKNIKKDIKKIIFNTFK
jgi:hypothetical protein